MGTEKLVGIDIKYTHNNLSSCARGFLSKDHYHQTGSSCHIGCTYCFLSPKSNIKNVSFYIIVCLISSILMLL